MGRKTISFGAKGRPAAKAKQLRPCDITPIPGEFPDAAMFADMEKRTSKKGKKSSAFDKVTTAMKEAAVNANPLSDEKDSIFGLAGKFVSFDSLSPISQNPMGRQFGTFPVKSFDADAIATENAKNAFKSQAEANRKALSGEPLPGEGRFTKSAIREIPLEDKAAACCPDPKCQACVKKRERLLAEAVPMSIGTD